MYKFEISTGKEMFFQTQANLITRHKTRKNPPTHDYSLSEHKRRSSSFVSWEETISSNLMKHHLLPVFFISDSMKDVETFPQQSSEIIDDIFVLGSRLL